MESRDTTHMVIEPYAWLKQVFTELPKATCVEEIEALLPIRPVVDLDQVA